MNIERIVMVFAGIVVLASVILTLYVNVNWIYLAGFMGLNLIQASFTGFCPLALVLKRLGAHSGKAFG